MRGRFSHEQAVLDAVEHKLIADIPRIHVFKGQGRQNRFSIPGWDMQEGQQFQFGDLRIEAPKDTVIIEAESAGGVTNLVKYWPLLETGRVSKRLAILHLYKLNTANDFIAHRKLWEYLRHRMRQDLHSRCGLRWLDHWQAELLCYQDPSAATEAVVSLIKANLRMDTAGAASG